MTSILFAGLGQMGQHLARHIAEAARPRSIAVHGFDLDPGKAATARDYGIVPVQDLADLAADELDVLCLSLPDGTAVKTLLEASHLTAFRGIVLDFSSVPPTDARALAETLRQRGGQYVDAPVTGGVVGAEQGTLVSIVGGTEEQLADQAWILEGFSSRVVYAGSPGFGALLKTVSNMAGNIAALASIEAIIMARTAGIADNVLLEVINNGPARSYFSAVRYPKYVIPGTFDSGMRMGLVLKDLGIALDAAEDLGVDLALCSRGHDLWRNALERLGPTADTTQIIDHMAWETTARPWSELAAGQGQLPEMERSES